MASAPRPDHGSITGLLRFAVTGPISMWLAPLALFLASLALYSLNLGRMPLADEMHHVLAAQSMVVSGEPRIAEGVYERGLLYTWLVAQSFKLFGVSLAAARLPSLLSMAVLVPILFVWLRREAEPMAAWIGAGLFMVSPFAVEVAQFSRFYAPQTLALFVAAILIYEALRHPGHTLRVAVLLVAMLPFLGLATYLQPTTLLGVAGIGLWGVGAIALPLLSDSGMPRARKQLIVAGLVLLPVLAFLALWLLGLPQRLWSIYRSVPVFNEATQEEFWFYHVRYMIFYPTLWTLTGMIGIVAVARFPRPGWFLLVTFAVSFVLTSFGGPKGMRYLSYAQPYLYGLWGLGMAAVARPMASFLVGLRRQLAASMIAISGGGHERLATIVMTVALASLFAFNPFLVRTASLLAEVQLPGEKPTANWDIAQPALQPWVDRSDIVVTTEELSSLFFLGHYDVRFSPSKLGEQAPGNRDEFSRDFRTGRPIIGTNASMRLILDCFASGVVFGPIVDWAKPHLINRELTEIIEAETTPIELPPGSHMFAYGWEHEHAQRDGADCAAVRAVLPSRPSTQP